MKRWLYLGLYSVLVAVQGGWAQNTDPAAADPMREHVIWVMSDGLRWQEVFRGADPALLTKANNGNEPVEMLTKQFVRSTSEEARRALMPFLWTTMVPQGEIYGNRDKGSDAYVTNGINVSYPGYNETLTGYADPRISSNDNVPNPNLTVLEWLDRGWKTDDPKAHDLTAAFGAWEVIGGAMNSARCGFTVNVSYEPLTAIPITPTLELLNRWKAETPRVWPDEAFDAPTFYTAMEYLQAKRPRLLYISLGETDDWAHENRYGFYLQSAHQVDDYLRQLWDFVQKDPEYRGRTTIFFLPDHGRGEAPVEWQSHGVEIPESKYIFLGLLGAGVPAKGELGSGAVATQNQVAATVARLFGKDWVKEMQSAGKPLSEIRSK